MIYTIFNAASSIRHAHDSENGMQCLVQSCLQVHLSPNASCMLLRFTRVANSIESSINCLVFVNRCDAVRAVSFIRSYNYIVMDTIVYPVFWIYINCGTDNRQHCILKNTIAFPNSIVHIFWYVVLCAHLCAQSKYQTDGQRKNISSTCTHKLQRKMLQYT